VHVTYYVAVLEEDGFNSEHPYFHCFVAEPATEDGGDAVVPNTGEICDTGNYCAELENKSSMNDYFYCSISRLLNFDARIKVLVLLS
jgi:hypothetical protein